jgi:peptide/nickel transport system substrate-binding protein
MNYNNYSNAKFDEVHTAGEKAVDQAERMKLIAQLQEIVAEDAPLAYLYEYNNTVAVRSNISGFIFYPDRTTRFETLLEK